jgi:hypothetical protein
LFLFALRADNGKYVSAEAGPGETVLTATRDQRGTWETFQATELSGGNIAIETHFGQYLRAANGGGTTLTTDRSVISSEHEQFQMIRLPGNRLAFRTSNGRNYFRRNDARGPISRSIVNAGGIEIGARETFEFIPVPLETPPRLYVQLKGLSCKNTDDADFMNPLVPAFDEVWIEGFVRSFRGSDFPFRVPGAGYQSIRRGETWRNCDLFGVAFPADSTLEATIRIKEKDDTSPDDQLGFMILNVNNFNGPLEVSWNLQQGEVRPRTDAGRTEEVWIRPYGGALYWAYLQLKIR